MQNPSEQKLNNFWLGFAFGTITAGGAAYLLGTKQGREILKKILELSENWEENFLEIMEELGEEIGDKGSEIINEVKKLPTQKNHSSLDSLLNKMRHLTPSDNKKEKRFFVKE
jgi:GTPase SAR1 family protein